MATKATVREEEEAGVGLPVGERRSASAADGAMAAAATAAKTTAMMRTAIAVTAAATARASFTSRFDVDEREIYGLCKGSAFSDSVTSAPYGLGSATL